MEGTGYETRSNKWRGLDMRLGATNGGDWV